MKTTRDVAEVGVFCGQGWVVMLDGRQLKTPGKNNLVLPTQTLAMAIAAEWEYQA
jgi:ATP synthase F1 complex assembly factor 2